MLIATVPVFGLHSFSKIRVQQIVKCISLQLLTPRERYQIYEKAMK